MHLQSITLLELVQLYYSCDLPFPLELHLSFEPSRFIARYNAIKAEIEAQEVEEGEDEEDDEEEAGSGEPEEQEEAKAVPSGELQQRSVDVQGRHDVLTSPLSRGQWCQTKDGICGASWWR